MSSPLAEVFAAVLRAMSTTELAYFVTNDHRSRVLKGIVDGYYGDTTDNQVVFDTNRTWCGLLPAVAELFPESRIICCIRNPAWILDSVERLIQHNALLASRMFPETNGNLGNQYTRIETMTRGSFFGTAWHNLRQAWFSEQADRLIAIRYDSLVAKPAEVINQLYDSIGEERFPHDFDHVEYDEPAFDAILNTPGLHRVASRVEPKPRKTVLPPDLFTQNSNNEFWNSPAQNPRHVAIL